jgi:DNA-binding HxlR family transcriptional regulator
MREFAGFGSLGEPRLGLTVLDEAENERAPSGRPRRAWSPLTRALEATGDRWTLTIALALAPGRTRLTQLHRRLPGISTGVLERSLAQMVGLGLVHRERFKEMPPRVELELTEAGRELLPVARTLTRWGLRHLWSAPCERELVDIGALLRLLPLLLEDGEPLLDRTVEIVVESTDPLTWLLYGTPDGRVWLEEPAQEAPSALAAPAQRASATACLSGDSAAWIAALGPSSDRKTLRVDGDRRLGVSVLDALAGDEGQVCHNGPRDRQR